MKVEPGFEKDVIEEFLRPFSGGDLEPAIFFTLGEYDLVIVIEGSRMRRVILNCGRIPRILATREIVSFQLACESERLIETLRTHALCALIFIRTAGCFSSQNSRIDTALWEWWVGEYGETRHAPATALLGTFGDSELVTIARGDSLAQIYDTIARFKHAGPLVARTFSVICINHTALSPLTECQGPTLGAECTLQCTISCPPAAHEYIACGAQRILEHVSERVTRHSQPGQDDVLLNTTVSDDTSIVDLVQALLNLRSHNELPDLRSTTAVLAIRTDGLRRVASEKCPQADLPWINIEGLEATRIHDLRDVGAPLLRALYAFGNMAQDDQARDALVDMLGYMTSLRKEAAEADPRRPGELQSLAARLHPVSHGFSQRTLGNHAGVNPAESNVRHLIGGVQRIIQAAEAIPMEVFDLYGERTWPGFVVLGPYREFWSSRYQVIGLPPSHMWEPSRWAAILHETMHCFVESSGRLFSTNAGPLETAVEAARETIVTYGLPIQNVERHSLELLVDLLQLQVGPSWDPSVIIESRWRYLFEIMDLERDTGGRKAFLAARMLVLWLASRGHTEATLSNKIVKLGLDELRDEYEAWSQEREPKIVAESVCRLHEDIDDRSVIQTVIALWNVYTEVAARHAVRPERQLLRRRWWEEQRSSVVECTDDGIILDPEMVPSPVMYVYALSERYPLGMTEPQRSAAIMTLMEKYRDMMTAQLNRF